MRLGVVRSRLGWGLLAAALTLIVSFVGARSAGAAAQHVSINCW
jgi:hypothetical protein